jgi:GDP-L-fucose synthase
VAGHNGMVGSAVLKKLKSSGYDNIITRSRDELDLTDSSAVDLFFKNLSIEYVILCAAKVGGIHANNSYKADFISENISIGVNIVKSCHKFNIKKLINLGSSCIYPKGLDRPIVEEDLLSGPLEPTNEPYAIAKIATLKMCESFYHQYRCNFYSIMPCNLYGPNDNFDLETSHVLPALIRKVHEAKSSNSEFVEAWGTGSPLREFLYVDDLANAISYCLENIEASDIYDQKISHLNCGSNEEISILNLLLKIKKILKYNGDIIFNKNMPDGTMRKKMDNTRISKLGFVPQVTMEEGLLESYKSFLKKNKE